jgi:O-antigen/teichoic acid export membrane protein
MKEKLKELLRRSERYTKTDMVYLASGSFYAFLTQLIVLGGSFILAIIVGHYLPKAVYGEYKYILALIALLGTFSLNGVGPAVFQWAAHGYGAALEKGFWANLRWSIPLFVLAFLLAGYYYFAGNHPLAFELLIGGSFAPLIASASLFTPYLGGYRDFRRQALYGVLDNLIPIASLMLAVVLGANALELVAVAPLLFTYFFPQYYDALGYSRLYALWILTVAFDPAYTYLAARKRVRELYISSTVLAVSQVVCITIGAYFWGLLGVIVARMTTRTLVAATNYICYRYAFTHPS